MTTEPPKRIKRAIRELAGAAHEIELRRALGPLRGQFARWDRGEIDAFELTDAVRRFHQGPARDLYNRYTSNMLNVAVAHAIVTGIVDRAQIAPDVLEHLRNAIAFYESQESA